MNTVTQCLVDSIKLDRTIKKIAFVNINTDVLVTSLDLNSDEVTNRNLKNLFEERRKIAEIYVNTSNIDSLKLYSEIFVKINTNIINILGLYTTNNLEN